MPRWLSDALKARLELQRVPFRLVNGPQPLDQRQDAEPHIVLQSDERIGDTFSPPRGLGPTEAHNLQLYGIGMELLIFARSPLSGAETIDHDEQARLVVKQLVAALYHVFKQANLRFRMQNGRLLSRDELDERRLTQWSGRVYRLGFGFDDTIRDENYKGAGLDTVDGGDITFETDTETLGQAGGYVLPSASTELG